LDNFENSDKGGKVEKSSGSRPKARSRAFNAGRAKATRSPESATYQKTECHGVWKGGDLLK